MLSIDETSIVKNEYHFISVKCRYCVRLGEMKKCQSGVHFAYASDKGYGFVDYELYIPEEWIGEEYFRLHEEWPILKKFYQKQDYLAHTQSSDSE